MGSKNRPQVILDFANGVNRNYCTGCGWVTILSSVSKSDTAGGRRSTAADDKTGGERPIENHAIELK
jgi:hypothetical protein